MLALRKRTYKRLITTFGSLATPAMTFASITLRYTYQEPAQALLVTDRDHVTIAPC